MHLSRIRVKLSQHSSLLSLQPLRRLLIHLKALKQFFIPVKEGLYLHLFSLCFINLILHYINQRMGNKWTGISTDYLLQAELDLFRRGGLEASDLHITDVSIGFQSTNPSLPDTTVTDRQL